MRGKYPGLISNIEKPRAFRQSGMKRLYHLFHEPLVIATSLSAPAPLSLPADLAAPSQRLLRHNLHFHLTLPDFSGLSIPTAAPCTQASDSLGLCAGVLSLAHVSSRDAQCTAVVPLDSLPAGAQHLPPTAGLVHMVQVLLLLSSLLPFVLALIFVFKGSASTLFFWWHSVTLRT